MAADTGSAPQRWLRLVTIAAAVLTVAGLVLVLAMPGPAARRYPQRRPVRFWHMWTAEWKVVVERIVQEFNDSQDVYEVIPLSIPAQSADTKFLLAAAGGDPPDVMGQWNSIIPTWAENGLLVPLNRELMTPAEWDTFQRRAYPVCKKIGVYKGDLYGVATGTNIWACYLRLDHLREAGLRLEDFPDTLEGLVTWGRRLQRSDATGHLTRAGFLPDWYLMYCTGFGGGFYDWENYRLTLDTPGNLRALEFIDANNTAVGKDQLQRFRAGLNWGSGIEWPFITGAFAITVDGQWRVEQLRQYAPALEYAVRPIPPPAGGQPHFGWANGNFMIVPRGAREPRGAWEFIRFWSGLANPERAATYATWGGWLPLTPDVANAPAYRDYVAKHPQFQTFLEVMDSPNVCPTPPVPYQSFLMARISRTEEKVWFGRRTPAQALAELADEVARELARRKELGYAD
jgi:multiple sugar transport system substrate-binding protein